MITILQGDALTKLRELPDESVHCCVTSPPYWGLRDYGTAEWEGGEKACLHRDWKQIRGSDPNFKQSTNNNGEGGSSFAHSCPLCGATRIDSQLGLEKTPEEYVVKMVELFREVRRVLRRDGTLWLNLGDSYASASACDRRSIVGNGSPDETCKRPNRLTGGLKEKDLCGIPWSVAKALQQPYYIGRIKAERDRIWLAAIIDAEGSICGFTHKRKDNGDIRRGVHVTVTNSNTAILDECFRIWPTTREEHNFHTKGHLGSLQTWRWIAHGMDEKSQLLAELYPYLIGKKKQALLAWNFIEISKQARGRNKGKEGDQNRKKSAWIVHALSHLNHLESVDIPIWIKEPPSQFEDGWWLRSDIIWAKPNPMPESVTDRTTKAHEYIFLLTKSANYFYDAEAIKENAEYGFCPGGMRASGRYLEQSKWQDNGDAPSPSTTVDRGTGGSRNKRSVWTVATAPYPEAHFATYPPDLVKPCIMAGTSAKGCCASCGAPWERVVEQTGPSTYAKVKGDRSWREMSAIANEQGTTPSRPNSGQTRFENGTQPHLDAAPTKTLGWQPTCRCEIAYASHAVNPCVVIDPFAGSGTTGMVALELGRKVVLIELNPKYIELIETRCNTTIGLPLC